MISKHFSSRFLLQNTFMTIKIRRLCYAYTPYRLVCYLISCSKLYHTHSIALTHDIYKSRQMSLSGYLFFRRARKKNMLAIFFVILWQIECHSFKMFRRNIEFSIKMVFCNEKPNHFQLVVNRSPSLQKKRNHSNIGEKNVLERHRFI